MAAAYPNTVQSFSVKQDFVTTVDAADPNSIQDEVVAIETVIGTNPHVSTAPASTGTFVATSVTYASLAARLANIEQGIVGDTHVHYMKLAGGSTVTSSAVGVVGLTYKAITSQTANFITFRDASNAVIGFISPAAAASFSSLTVTGQISGATHIGTVVPVAFHVSGILTTGIKVAKYIATCPMTLKSALAVLDSGSGATYQIRVNGALPTGMTASAAVGTTVASFDFTDVTIAVNDRIQVEVVNAGSSASDLSVTLNAVTA